MQDKCVDVLFYIVGVGVSVILQIVQIIDVKLILVSGNQVVLLFKKYFFYVCYNIFVKSYKGQGVMVFGVVVQVILVISLIFDIDIVYKVMKVVFFNEKVFKILYFILVVNYVDVKVIQGLFVLFYFGVVKFWKEQGLNVK